MRPRRRQLVLGGNGRKLAVRVTEAHDSPVAPDHALCLLARWLVRDYGAKNAAISADSGPLQAAQVKPPERLDSPSNSSVHVSDGQP